MNTELQFLQGRVEPTKAKKGFFWVKAYNIQSPKEKLAEFIQFYRTCLENTHLDFEDSQWKKLVSPKFQIGELPSDEDCIYDDYVFSLDLMVEVLADPEYPKEFFWRGSYAAESEFGILFEGPPEWKLIPMIRCVGVPVKNIMIEHQDYIIPFKVREDQLYPIYQRLYGEES